MAGLAHLLAPLNVHLMTLAFISHGLVVGKFCPPLAGRVLWLRAACGGLSGVTVTGVRCDVPVDFGDEIIWTARAAVMTVALEEHGRRPVDAVFSSEPYGEEPAVRLGAEHVSVDPGRQVVPVPAGPLRADRAGHWDHLLTAARRIA